MGIKTMAGLRSAGMNAVLALKLDFNINEFKMDSGQFDKPDSSTNTSPFTQQTFQI